MDGRLVESTRLSCESPVYQMVATGDREALVELDTGMVLTYSKVRTFVTLDMKLILSFRRYSCYNEGGGRAGESMHDRGGGVHTVHSVLYIHTSPLGGERGAPARTYPVG
jgi:hypothetical protein